MNKIPSSLFLISILFSAQSCQMSSPGKEEVTHQSANKSLSDLNEATALLDAVDAGKGLTSDQVDRCIALLHSNDADVRFSVGLALSQGARSGDRARAVEALVKLLKREPHSLIDGATGFFILSLNPKLLPRLKSEMDSVKETNKEGYQHFQRLLPHFERGAANLVAGRPFAFENPMP